MFNKPIHSFDNRTVLVVGASSGIGFEIAKALEILGENLIVAARRADILEANFSQNTRIPVDIADEEAMGKFFELIRKKNLDIDTVFWCAAVYSPMTYIDFSYKEAKKITCVNLTSVYYPFFKITQTWLKERDKFLNNPHWIWISSVAGYVGLPGSCAYGPTKSALNNIAESAFVEFKPFNIDISLVCPGFVDTRLTKKNKFYMPFIITPEQASKEIFYGLKRGLFEIHFPKKFTLILKTISLFPYKLIFLINAKLRGKNN